MTTTDPPCSACGSGSTPGALFCRHCGMPLEVHPRPASPGVAGGPPIAEVNRERKPASTEAPAGELKQVTVMFADVQGSVALSEQTDPEEWHAILSRFFALLAGAARRYGGVVSRFTGDGIMALFGAPVAQEDHAQRACHAAIHARDALSDYAAELRRAKGLSLSVRIGLHSGPVVAAWIGEAGASGYTALGPTVSVAERMERLAEPGHIYLTESTALLAGGFFELRDLGRFDLRLSQDPMRVFELERRGQQRTRLEFARQRGLSQFVGRDDEIATLEAVLESASRGEGQVVEIVGDAGVGKSRICAEFTAEARHRGVSVVEIHGFAHLASMSYLTLIEDLRSAAQIDPRDPDQVAREKIDAFLLAWDPDMSADLALFHGILGLAADGASGLPRDPGSQAHALASVIERMAAATTRTGPVVLLVEDAQWLDPGSAGLLEALLWTVPATHLLVLLTFRPGYRPPRLPLVHVERIELAPLGTAAADEMLHTLLGDNPSVAPLATRIRDRARGNPFYLEEIVWSLSDGGFLDGERGRFRLTRPAQGVPLPATLQATLGARIDQLPAEQKRVLQVASVIGIEFDAALLRRVLGEDPSRLASSLTGLSRGGFLDRSDLDEQERYRFSHPLMHEEVYFSQLGDVRMRSHAMVALALAEIDSSQIDARAGLLAHHWENAGEALQAARWMARAAGWVSSRKVAEGLRSWTRVRDLVEGLPREEALQLAVDARVQMLVHGARIGLSEADSARIFAEGEVLASRLGDRRRLSALFGARSQVLGLAGDAQGSLELGRRALALVEGEGDRSLTRDRRAELMFGLFSCGRFREVCELAESTLVPWPDGGEQVVLEDPHDVWILLFHAMSAVDMGKVVEARREIDIVIEAAQRIGALETLCVAWGFSPVVAQIAGDRADIELARARRALQLAEGLESPLSSYFARWGVGIAQLSAENWEEAERLLRSSLAGARESGVGLQGEAGMMSNLAEAIAGRGDLEGAVALAREAISVGRRRGTSLFECLALLTFARFQLMAGDAAVVAEVEGCIERADEIIEADGLASMKPLVHVLRAFLAAGAGAADRAEKELRVAQALFLRMGAPGNAERVAALLPGLVAP